VQFRVLGDLAVQHDHRAISLGAHQQRALLAILVVNAGEVVTADRLIDGIWGDEPPARAAKTVQVYVSRLRKALAAGAGAAADDVIVTRDHGYALHVDPDQVDAAVFERLLAEGRRELADGAFALAAERLNEALALWRGPALSDFTFDAWAAEEIARLEELRLEALESRIDADLELGRHAALVAELEALIARHPLREHLRGQLMLALYRGGRQSDALAVFKETRRVLVDELGLEPGPALRARHEAILRQDPALDASAPLPPSAVEREGERRLPRWAVAGVLGTLVAAAAVAAVLVLASGGAPVTVAPNSVAVIDPGRNAVTRAIAVGARPGDISTGAGGVWVANLDDDSVSKIDPRAARVVSTWSTGKSVDGLTTAGGAVWTLDGPDATALRIDPNFGQVVKRTPLGKAPGGTSTARPSPIGAAPNAVWAATGSAGVARIAMSSGDVTGTASLGNEPAGIADGAGATWVADDLDDTVSRIDRAGVVTGATAVGHTASAIAVGAAGVWVADTADAKVTRLDPATGAATDTIDVGAGPSGIAVGAGAVWVANSLDGTVSRIDPQTNRVVDTIHVGGSPDRVAIAAGRVWVTVQAGTAPVGAVSGGIVRILQQTDFNSTDPALMASYGPQAAQLEFATCAKLLDYPDQRAPQGTRLVPEVAAAMPAVSADGRAYTFTVRPGFRFSPPSGQPVTARAFAHALERFLSPRVHDPAGIDFVFSNVVGYAAYHSGRARHLAGLTATDRTLTIRLQRPDPRLPALMAMPYLCAVPPDTPIRAQGIDRIPSAGPYYIAFHAPGRELTLLPNPYYRGSRPRRPTEIDYRFGFTPDRAAALVESGRADYADAAVGDPHVAASVTPALRARLRERYGPGSAAARANRQRYFVDRTLGLQYLLLNSRRKLLATARMRRAVNFALNRSALAATAGPGFFGLPTDQYLPTGMPGFRDADIYPLGGPDVARARSLAGGRRRHAVMYTCNKAACLRGAEIVKANLGAIGIDVQIRRFPILEMFRREFTPGEPYDLGWWGWTVDYPDPSDFVDIALAGPVYDPRLNRDASPYRRQRAQLSGLSGEQRLRGYGRLDVDLAARSAPLAAFANLTGDDFFSAPIGCQVFQPIYGMDLGALCRRR
jgi:YVTN family beta-propeller protein